MAKVGFSVKCYATYRACADVPDEIADNPKEIVKVLRDSIPELNVEDLEWLEDLDDVYDAITEQDIIWIEKGE